MKLFELRDKCNELLKEGFDSADVYFDTEAMCFDVHMVKIKNIHCIEKGKIDNDSYAVLTFDFGDALIRSNK